METTNKKDLRQTQEKREDLGDQEKQQSDRGPKELCGKPDWYIFPFEEAEQVLEVFSYGAKKYGAPFTYRRLIPQEELLSATMRHLIEIHKGNYTDTGHMGSNLTHWAHIAANALMALSHYTKRRKVNN